MATPSQQIGQSQEAKIMSQIIKTLDRLTVIASKVGK